MSNFWRLISRVKDYGVYTSLGIFFHVLTAIFTVISIPLVIPFFQLLFGAEANIDKPSSGFDLEGQLHYFFQDMIVEHGSQGALIQVCVIVVVVFALKNFSRFMIAYFMVPVRNGVLKDIRSSIWSSFDAMTIQSRFEKKQGYLMSLITNDLAEVDHGILKVFELLFKTPLVVLGSLILMVWLSPTLTMIAFVLIVFTVLVVGGVSHVLKRQSAQAQQALSGISELADEYLGAFREVKAFNAGGYFRKLFDKQNQDYFEVTKKMLRRRDLASPLAEFLGVVTIVVLLYTGAQQVMTEAILPSTFFAFIFAFYNIIDPAKSFSREYANVQRGLAALDRIDEFVIEGSGHAPSSKEDHKAFEKEIKLDGITFRFKRDTPLLNGLSLSIKKGKKVGIVGYSGQGKTTILDLILGFYDVDTGVVSIDGGNINTVQQEAYRGLFGLVGQAPVLFYGTVRDNILLGAAADSHQLHKVLQLANLPASILYKRVGDSGAQLSGGEGQRIAIARALYRAPDILLLDEPTSSLDAKNRSEVVASIMASMEERTVVMISHNISLLTAMDHIVVLDQGSIVAAGTYQELSDTSDIFSSLIHEG